MAFSRRSFLGGSAAALVAGAVEAAPGAGPQPDEQLHSPAETAAMSLEALALNRIAYGPRAGDMARVRSIGLTAYVDEQLNPNDAADTECNQKIAAATLRIAYAAGTGYPAVDEMRPLESLSWTLAQAWARTKHASFSERNRPADEMRAATWIRAVYSKWQLRELMQEFWVNHFSVNVQVDSRIAATWSYVVREVYRKHAFGNFKTLCTEVAKSIAMQYYLDNATSRDGPANENYARELFELHTLGSVNYFNDLYDRWQLVPGAAQGKPVGYIDADVYESARAFTGWTIADGASLGNGTNKPDTGEFFYAEVWHDSAQKRVLAQEFLHSEPPMSDGNRVLDILANHEGVMRFLCTKLCQRFVGDDPPVSVIDKAVATWKATVNDPAQIKKVLRTILLSDEFKASAGKKVKRPFEFFAAYIRAILGSTGTFTINSNLFYRLSSTGYLMYNWPTPTGIPDYAGYWLTTNGMLQRWNTLYSLQSTSYGVTVDLRGQQPASVVTCRQIVSYWVDRLFGYALDGASTAELVDFVRQGGSADAAPTGSDSDITTRINNLVMLMGMIPAFQWR